MEKDEWLIDKTKQMLKTIKHQNKCLGAKALNDSEYNQYIEWLGRDFIKVNIYKYFNSEEKEFYDSVIN
jgi:hypothetical protein